MDNRKHHYSDPWDERVYGTGNTEPPKSHGGIIALLSIIIIFLSGLVTFLSILNIRMFHQLNARADAPAPVSFSAGPNGHMAGDSALGVTAPTLASGCEGELVLNQAPELGSSPEEPTLSRQAVCQAAAASVVGISCRNYDGTDGGNGVIISADGTIVTNCHLVEDAESITVTLSDGSSLPAVLTGMDRVTDLAVLKVQASGLQAAIFGNSSAVQIGQSVIGLSGADDILEGVLSTTGCHVSMGKQRVSLLQTSIIADCGTPLLNAHGQVIGIFTAGYPTGEEGFVIPSTTVKRVVDQLLNLGYVPGRPGLGFHGKFLGLFEQHYYNIPEGLYITGVDLGVTTDIQVGDVLISMNGAPIRNRDELNAALYACDVGEVVTLVLNRNGESLPVQLTLTENQ